MEFLAMLSLVASGGMWPPAPEPVGVGIQLRTLEKGMTLAQVRERLGLAGEAPSLVIGTSMSHRIDYDIGSAHTLSLGFRSGKDGWEFYDAELRANEPRANKSNNPVPWDSDLSHPWAKAPKP